jgi:hypothetical protein
VKATDGRDQLESVGVLVIPRAHRVLFFYPLSIPLQGIANANDLERVRMCPSSTVDVFEAETGDESD